MKQRIRTFFALGFFLFVLPLLNSARASHSWENFHWARTANPLSLQIGDNVSGQWDSYLVSAISDWNVSSVLTLTKSNGQAKGNCNPVAGRVEVCNKKYGNNGWMGVAQVWLTEGNHIYQGTVRLNDYYLGLPAYNTPAWRSLVMCQEIAHTLGLDHQDEDFYNLPLGTCMDYSIDPEPNQHPNAHDYEQLEAIYAHTDSFDSFLIGTKPGKNLLAPNDWGIELRRKGRVAEYRKTLENGDVLATLVILAD